MKENSKWSNSWIDSDNEHTGLYFVQQFESLQALLLWIKEATIIKSRSSAAHTPHERALALSDDRQSLTEWIH